MSTRWPCFRLIKTRISIAFAGFLLSLCLHADDINKTHRVENLAYGQALFQYFQDKQLDAITGLMVAELQPQSQNQRDESDLLLADLYYRYGLYEESNQLFSRLLSGDTAKGLLNRVWFNLARLNHDQGYYQRARELLAQIDDTLLPDHLKNEKQYLLSNLFLSENQFNAAQDASSKIDAESVWHPYSRYNLGVTLLENNQLDDGKSLLEILGEMPATSEETLALRDQANLSLGLSMLRNSRPETALASFERVSLQGPFSHNALLGAGWAWNELDQFSKALVPWLELAEKNAIDAATQEALLAIPTALEKNEKPKLAVQYYELAARQFDKQLQALGEVSKTISRGELIDILQINALVLEGASYGKSSLQSSTAPYLHILMASKSFQQAVQRLRELIEMQATLNRWQFNLPALSTMLDERRQRFQDKLPLLQQSTDFDNLEELKNSRDLYTTQLREIESNENYLALANVEEKEQLEILASINSNLESIGSERDTSEEKDMHRLLSGLLHWQIGTNYAPRLWSAKKQLIELDNALEISQQRANSLRQISGTSLQQFDGFESRIKDKEQRIYATKQQITDLVERQQQRINRLATEAIVSQQQHIIQLRLNTRYALARLYDTLVTEQ